MLVLADEDSGPATSLARSHDVVSLSVPLHLAGEDQSGRQGMVAEDAALPRLPRAGREQRGRGLSDRLRLVLAGEDSGPSTGPPVHASPPGARCSVRGCGPNDPTIAHCSSGGGGGGGCAPLAGGDALVYSASLAGWLIGNKLLEADADLGASVPPETADSVGGSAWAWADGLLGSIVGKEDGWNDSASILSSKVSLRFTSLSHCTQSPSRLDARGRSHTESWAGYSAGSSWLPSALCSNEVPFEIEK